jgi:hypothetical protein
MGTIPSKGSGALIFRTVRNFWAALKMETAKSKGSFSYICLTAGQDVTGQNTQPGIRQPPLYFSELLNISVIPFLQAARSLLGHESNSIYSIDQSPSWEANSRSASQEIPHILCYSQVRFRVPNSMPPVPILSQINSIHNPNPTSWRSTLILS